LCNDQGIGYNREENLHGAQHIKATSVGTMDGMTQQRAFFGYPAL
jgi:hypothetical protein